MTSKKYSRDSLMKSINKERAWASALMALCTFLWFGVAELISLNITRTSYTTWSAGALSTRIREAATEFLGIGSHSIILVWGFALLFGLQSFSYLYDSKKVDFYFSQPITRKKRFIATYMSAVVSYLLIMGCGMLFGLLIAALRGGFYGALVPAVIIEYINLFIQFISLYSITILASALCGNIFAALCSTAFFWLAEIVIRAMVYALADSYFATFGSEIGDFMGHGFTSPILNYVSVFESAMRMQENPGMAAVSTAAIAYLPMMIKNLSLGIVAAILAYLAFEKRKLEYAGKSVAFPFMEHIYKCVAAWIGGTGMGLIIVSIFDTNSPLSASAIFAICVGVFTVCVVGEGIFAMNVRRVFHRAWQIPAMVAVCVLVMTGFYYDWTGYDRFSPEPDQISAITIYPNDSYNVLENYYRFRDGYYPAEYLRENTRIADVDAALTVAREGQRQRRSMIRDGITDEQLGESVTVEYFMKNGSVKYRSAILPADIDSSVMDRILSQDDYAEAIAGAGAFTGSDGSYDIIKKAKSADLSVDMYLGELIPLGKKDEAGEFMDCYRADVDENLSYTMLQSEEPLCHVQLDLVYANDDGSDNSCVFPIFPSYARCLGFMEDHGVDVSDEAFYDKLFSMGRRAAEVTVEDSDTEKYEIDYDTESTLQPGNVTYDTTDEIMEILGSVGRYSEYNFYRRMPFMKKGGSDYYNVYLSGDDEYAEFSMKKDKAPDFVKADLERQ